MPPERLSEAHRQATDVSEPKDSGAVKMRVSESLRGVTESSCAESGHWMSAHPPIADVNGHGAGGPFLTHSRH